MSLPANEVAANRVLTAYQAELNMSRPGGGAGKPLINQYAVLGVAQTAAQGDISVIFRKQALLLHPDRNTALQQTDPKLFSKLNEAFQKINEAHEILRDTKQRESLNIALSLSQQSTHQSPQSYYRPPPPPQQQHTPPAQRNSHNFLSELIRKAAEEARKAAKEANARRYQSAGPAQSSGVPDASAPACDPKRFDLTKDPNITNIEAKKFLFQKLLTDVLNPWIKKNKPEWDIYAIYMNAITEKELQEIKKNLPDKFSLIAVMKFMRNGTNGDEQAAKEKCTNLLIQKFYGSAIAKLVPLSHTEESRLYQYLLMAKTLCTELNSKLIGIRYDTVIQKLDFAISHIINSALEGKQIVPIDNELKLLIVAAKDALPLNADVRLKSLLSALATLDILKSEEGHQPSRPS